jgi:hypothetical protein
MRAKRVLDEVEDEERGKGSFDLWLERHGQEARQ